MTDDRKRRIRNDDGYVSVWQSISIGGMIVCVFIFSMIAMSSYDGASLLNEENEYLSEFYEDRVIDNITENKNEIINWDKRIEFANGEVVYVKILCESGGSENSNENNCELKKLKDKKIER